MSSLSFLTKEFLEEKYIDKIKKGWLTKYLVGVNLDV